MKQQQSEEKLRDKEAEEATLCGLLTDPYQILEIIDDLKPSDFYFKDNRLVYEGIIALHESDEPVDLMTVCDQLERSGTLSKVQDGAAYITRLASGMYSISSTPYYAKKVKELSDRRKYIRVAGQIAKVAYDLKVPIEQIADQSEKWILKSRPIVSGRDYKLIGEIAEGEIDRLENLDKDAVIGISSGLIDLDKVLGGFQKKDFIIIAGRPGMGKSSLALSCLIYAAKILGKNVALHSLEMGEEQLGQRAISAESGINTVDLRLGNLKNKYPEFFQATQDLQGVSLFVDDTPAISVLELRTKAKRLDMKLEGGLDLLVIDYIQLMRGGGKFESRQREVSYISGNMKALAKEMNIPVIALAQLSRKVEERKDKTPLLSDLRESGSLEQDSDVVLFLYRDEIYNLDTEFPNVAEIIISKQRNGPTGRISVYFRKHLAQFVDLEVRRQPLE